MAAGGGGGRTATIAVALAGAGFALALALFRDAVSLGRVWTDGTSLVPGARVAKARRVLWGPPEPCPADGAEALPTLEPAFSPDGARIVFASGTPGRNMELHAGRLSDGRIEDVRALRGVNSPYDDRAPDLAGDLLAFASDRPGGAGGLDLYVASWEAGDPQAPRALSTANSSAQDTDPAFRPGAGGLAFASDRSGGFDLYFVESLVAEDAATSEPVVLAELSSPLADRAPAFRPDGRALFFASDRAGSARGFDLLHAWFDPASRWTDPVPLAGFATAADETDPSLSPEGFALLFTRTDRAAAAPAELAMSRSVELLPSEGGPSAIELLALAALLLIIALLAWLGRRFRALDLLSKCLLLSLLLHLLLLLLSRRVQVDSESQPTPTKGPSYRVKVLPSDELQAAASGRAEAGAVAYGDGPALSRSDASAPDAPAAPSATSPAADLRLESPGDLVRAESARLEGPSAPEPGASAAPPETLEDRDPAAGEKRSGGAPGLAVGTTDTTSGPAEAVVFRGNGPAGPGGAAPTPASVAIGTRGQAVPAAGGNAVRLGPSSGAGIAAASPPLAAPTPPAAGPPREGPSATLVAGPRTLGRETSDAIAMPRSEVRPGPGSGGATGGTGPGRVAIASPVSPLPERAGGSSGEAPGLPGPAAESKAGPELKSPAAPPARAPASAGAGGQTAPVALVARSFERAGEPAGGEVTRRGAAGPAPAGSDAPARPAPLEIDLPPPKQPSLPTLPPAPLEGTPYEKRSGTEKAVALQEFGGSEETERAVAAGLRYLASIQRPAGHWGDRDDRNSKYRDVLYGKTGLALLAFLGAGHTHRSKTEHSAVVARAIAFLLSRQDERGHVGDCEAYSHGICAYALGEAYAMTKDPELREPLERAIGRILETQERRRDPRLFGGWSYYYPDGATFDPWPRASITAWQVMAIESARLGGLSVPDEAFEAARAYLENSFDEERSYFRYSHDPERLASAYRTLPGSTPAAIFALTLLGGGDDPRVRASLPFVRERRPRAFAMRSEERFVARADGNLYFWYYGTLAFFQRGGRAWGEWNDAMKGTLLPAQDEDGSWPPIDPYARIAGDDPEERSYTTALCVLMLEVYYRYFTPLLRWHPSMPSAREPAPSPPAPPPAARRKPV